MPVAKDASRRIVDLLVGSGVRMQVWRLPAELRERPAGPSLQPDDLLDFHLQLQQDDWFEQLSQSVDGLATLADSVGAPLADPVGDHDR